MKPDYLQNCFFFFYFETGAPDVQQWICILRRHKYQQSSCCRAKERRLPLLCPDSSIGPPLFSTFNLLLCTCVRSHSKKDNRLQDRLSWNQQWQQFLGLEAAGVWTEPHFTMKLFMPCTSQRSYWDDSCELVTPFKLIFHCEIARLQREISDFFLYCREK